MLLSSFWWISVCLAWCPLLHAGDGRAGRRAQWLCSSSLRPGLRSHVLPTGTTGTTLLGVSAAPCAWQWSWNSWGCLQGEGGRWSITGVCSLPWDLTAQVSGEITNCICSLSHAWFPSKYVSYIAPKWPNPRCASRIESTSGSHLTCAPGKPCWKDCWHGSTEHVSGETGTQAPLLTGAQYSHHFMASDEPCPL